MNSTYTRNKFQWNSFLIQFQHLPHKTTMKSCNRNEEKCPPSVSLQNIYTLLEIKTQHILTKEIVTFSYVTMNRVTKQRILREGTLRSKKETNFKKIILNQNDSLKSKATLKS